jgi:Fe-S-cluster containining protein
VALPIDTPKTKKDYDDIRWYLAHKKIQVFVEDGDWYIQFFTRCKYLDKDLMCKIYDERPKICRKYEHDECEHHGDDYSYEAIFNSIKDIERYRDKKLKKKKKDKKK